MNAYANHVVNYLFTQSWQVAILAGLVGLLSFTLRNHSAHIRYLLWLVVLAKCLVPPFLTVPLAVLPEQQAEPLVSGFSLPVEDTASEIPAVANGDIKPRDRAPTLLSAHEVAALVWTAGLAVFLLWVGGRAIRCTSWLHVRRRPLSPSLAESLQELSDRFKFRRLPKIWLLEDVSQPFVWGVFRGSVYLPTDFAALGGSDQRQSILAHEFSHIARFDAGVNLLQVLAQAMYWFHPFVWWANRKLRQEREKCCDEMAIAHLNTPAEHYTGAIVNALAAERRSTHPIPSLAIVGSIKDIEERIKTMLKPGRKFYRRPSLVAGAVALLIALVTIPTALVLTARGEERPTNHNVGQAAAESEKPEQPRYGARTFNSKLAMDVWVRETSSPMTERRIGRTPSTTPLEIPACHTWSVRLEGPVQDWDLLVREMSHNRVPGLTLPAATDSDLAHLADLSGLEQLNLAGEQITDAGMEHLRGLTGLRGLMLASIEITDTGLAPLKDMTKLQELTLAGKTVTDAGMEYLAGLTGLRRVWLAYCPVTDAGLAHLKGLTTLQDLNLTGAKVTDVGLEQLKDLTELQGLTLGSTQITDAGLVHLQGLTGLQRLGLGKTQITDAGLERLKGLTQLQELRLGGTQITDAGLAHLKHLTELRRLGLAGTKITDAGLEYLNNLAGLQELRLDETQVTDACLVHLRGLTGLRSLDLSSTQVTDAGVRQLEQALPNLTVMRGPTQSTMQSAAKLAQLPNKPAADSEKPEQPQFVARTFNSSVAFDVFALETSGGRWKTVGHTPDATPVEIPACWLWWVKPSAPVENWGLLVRELSQNKVPGLDLGSATDSDLKRLAADVRELQRLGLSKTQVTDAGLGHLAGLTRLQWLNLSNTNITDAGLAHLAGLTRLQFLDLESTQITDAGLEHFKGLTGLRLLNVVGTQISDVGVGHLKGLTGMKELLLSGRLTDSGLEHLKGLTRLRTLYLGGKITDGGLAQLSGLTELRWLGIDSNQITDTGIEHLRGLAGLEQLFLHGTRLTDAGLARLTDLTRLQNLDVSGAQITDAGLVHLKSLTTLQILNLTSTKITDAGLRHLKDLTGLEALVLSDTQVTDTGAQQLKQSLPRLTVVR